MAKLAAVITLMLATSAFAESLPACPDSGVDPSKFCPVGMQWSEASQSCVAMI